VISILLDKLGIILEASAAETVPASDVYEVNMPDLTGPKARSDKI